MRAPEVAQADTMHDKVEAYWTTLATQPDEGEQAAALACLAELQREEDDTITATTNELIQDTTMTPTHLSIRGITRFSDTIELDLSALPHGLICVQGGNGEGKTTIMETMAPVLCIRVVSCASAFM